MSELETLVDEMARMNEVLIQMQETLGTVQEALGLLLDARTPVPQADIPTPPAQVLPVASYAQMYGPLTPAHEEEALRYTNPEPPRRLAMWPKKRRP
jgi:histidinol dehydrogenase